MQLLPQRLKEDISVVLGSLCIVVIVFIFVTFRFADVDECASRPCLHGGTCVDETNSFRCVCEGYFRGTICQYGENNLRSLCCAT